MFVVIIFIIIFVIILTVSFSIASTSHDKPEDFPSSAVLDQKCEHGHFYYDEQNKCLYIIGFGLNREVKRKVENIVKSNSFAEKFTSSYILIDEENRHVLFAKASKKEIKVSVFDFDKLVGMEIIQDGKVVYKKGVIGGALLGGALLGETGAIIGGMSGDTSEGGYICSYKILFSLDDMKQPIVEFELLDNAIDMSSDLDRLDFSEIKLFGSKVKSTLLAVIEHSNREKDTKIEVKKVGVSVAEELKKLAELKEAGILSEEEFITQKKRLLQ